MADLTASLSAWIESSGRALELRVARLFQTTEDVAFVQQSVSYEDIQSKQPREGDVFALYRLGAPESYLNIGLAIECKAGTAHPWVAFYDHRRTVPETTRAWFLEGPMRRDADIPRHGSQALLEGWLAADGLPVDRLATHAVSALGKDPKDGAKNFVRDAALQALSFAQARAARPINMIGDQTLPNEWFVLPLVVAKAPLFACYLAEDGEVVLERVERFDLAMQSPDGRRRVYVVSEEELVRMASALRQCMRAWLSNLEEEQPQNDLS